VLLSIQRRRRNHLFRRDSLRVKGGVRPLTAFAARLAFRVAINSTLFVMIAAHGSGGPSQDLV
jgi:hypothetical protein